jgi:hypothetical protein
MTNILRQIAKVDHPPWLMGRLRVQTEEAVRLDTCKASIRSYPVNIGKYRY